MVAELCKYVILGHSERRQYFGETDGTVNKKVKAALGVGLTPIVCVGETFAENEAGQTASVVSRQVKAGLADLSVEQALKLVIAYEPIWAIGTGRAATANGANGVLADVIRPALAALFGVPASQQIRILYGGSVTADNTESLMACTDVDGLLVGGASLDAAQFTDIARAASRTGR